jgi:hypothetical protein
MLIVIVHDDVLYCVAGTMMKNLEKPNAVSQKDYLYVVKKVVARGRARIGLICFG